MNTHKLKSMFLTLIISSHLIFINPSSAEETVQFDWKVKPRARVIVDNDFGGDCDGLFALVHHVLSPSIEIRGIIGSHHYPNGFYGYTGSSKSACTLVKALLRAMNLDGQIPVYQGAEERIKNSESPSASDAANFIIREAMRDDIQTPLYIACGASLTDLANAYLIEPQIAQRIQLVWIGGPEYEDIAVPPPGGQIIEYNLGIDIKAAQVIFNQSEIPIWQVPRDTYRQALVTHAELRNRMAKESDLTSFLLGRLHDLLQRSNFSLGEGYILGDSPLVLLTALQSAWEPDPSSSKYTVKPAPRIADSGQYEQNPNGRQIRVYTKLDNRLMFEDFYAKMSVFNSSVKLKSQP